MLRGLTFYATMKIYSCNWRILEMKKDFLAERKEEFRRESREIAIESGLSERDNSDEFFEKYLWPCHVRMRRIYRKYLHKREIKMANEAREILNYYLQSEENDVI